MERNGDFTREPPVKRPAVFLDRDGTINEQMGYINHLSRFVLLPNVAEAIRLLNKREFLVLVVSNQSGAARGYFPIELVHEVHALMKKSLKTKEALINGIFFCPHHPRGVIPEFTGDCDCRKPKTGLIKQACKRFDIDLPRSYVVGDRYMDIELAHRCILKGILVKSGYGLGELKYVVPEKSSAPNHVAQGLIGAVRWILERDEPIG